MAYTSPPVGVMVTDVAAEFQARLRSLVSKPETEIAEAVDVVFIALLKLMVIVAFAVTPVAPFTGETEATVGGVVSGGTQVWPEQVLPETQSLFVEQELLQIELAALTQA